MSAVPAVRADGDLRALSGWLGVVAMAVLAAALAARMPWLVPSALALAGGTYALELAADDAALDASAPAVAAAVVVAAELAYWSLDEREGVMGERGLGARRVPLVAALGLGSVVLGTALLAVADAVRTRSLALDVGGALAAVGALAVVALAGRQARRTRL